MFYVVKGHLLHIKRASLHCKRCPFRLQKRLF